MPLPAALAARLKKRGIIHEGAAGQDPQEEIIDQDYSPDDGPGQQTAPSAEDVVVPPAAGETLPQGWFKVKDHVSGYYYYWDAEKDLVSWLSPLDAKAQITLPASKLQENRAKPPHQPLPPGTEARQSEVRQSEERRPEERRPERPSMGPIGPIRPSVDRKLTDRPAPYPKLPRENRDSHRQRRKKDDELDPMDPSAYSDAPRGNWSAGLPKTNEAKTGVDTTANGPLFQMRPYPSPGAVLRANVGKN